MTENVKSETLYHIFSDNFDEWLRDLTEATKLFDELSLEMGSARLYEEEREVDGDLLDETCIASFGPYPQ